MKDLLKLLGPSPSTVLQSEVAAPINATGYEVTDFAGLFNAPKAGFLVTLGMPPAYAIERGIEIESAGTLPIRSGAIVISDPCAWQSVADTSVVLAARIPSGDHEVHVAVRGGAVLAAVVVFGGGSEVVGWLPALLGDPAPAMPTPPVFPTPPVGSFLGLGDAVLMEEIFRKDAEWLAAPTGSAEQKGRAGSKRGKARPVSEGRHVSLEAVRHDLTGARRPKLLSAHGGLVAFRCDAPPTTWLGLDQAGELRALAFDFGALRRWDAEPHVSAPGLLLDRDSLEARFCAAGCPPADAPALVRSFLQRVRAAKDDVGSFEPTDWDRRLLEMPTRLRAEALRATSRAAIEELETHLGAEPRGAPGETAQAPALPASGPETPLEELELSVPAHHVLRALGLETAGDLAAKSEAELAKAFKKAGHDASKARREVRYIEDALATLSLTLRPG